MSGHHEHDKATIQSIVFQVPKLPAQHRSWHKKRDDDLHSRECAVEQIYNYKKKNISTAVTSDISCDYIMHQVASTVKPQESIKTQPQMLVSNTIIQGDEERVSTNIHINPLFALKNVDKNVKSWQQLPNKSSTPVNQSLSTASDEIVAQPSFTFKIPQPNLIHNLTTNQHNSIRRPTSARLTNDLKTAHTTSVPGESQSPIKTLNRPSIHVNPSILVSNCIKFPSDGSSDKPNQLRSDIINFYNTLQSLPNGKVKSVHINPLIHGANAGKSVAIESQRSVHINPVVLASRAAKKAANSKTSIHINPEVYARLKSEVHGEKPSTLMTPCSTTSSRVSDSSNNSVFTITRTKLVRASIPRSRKLSSRKIQQTMFQPVCNTPKVRKVSCSRTPPSTVVKTAKSVCSKYKFIRKSLQTTTLSLPSSSSKVPQFLSSIYKLDRRLLKTPKRLKKVKPYSIKYEGSRRNHPENISPRINVNKKFSSKKLSLASRVWRNPKSLPTRRSISKNRKLFKMTNSSSQKAKRNGSSSHKTLVRLDGVLYKTSRMKLTRTRTPNNKCTTSRMDGKMTYRHTKKSLNRSCILNLRGDKFLMDPLGRTLKRISTDKPRGIGSTKRIDIGGITFVQKSKNVLIRTNTHTVRNVLSQAKNKSIALLTTRMRKNNTHCRFYRRLGKCTGKEKGRCPCIHDPKYIMICKKFLKSECSGDGCLLSHEMIPEKMPACKFFIQGCCSRDDCPYLHVRTDFDAPICSSFLQGFCQEGYECWKRHLYVCPLFDKYGKCPKNKYCPYPHKSRESFKLDTDHMQITVEDILGDVKEDEPTTEGFRYFHFNQEPDIGMDSKVGTNVALEEHEEIIAKARTQDIDKLFDEAIDFAQMADIEAVKNTVCKIMEMRSCANTAMSDLEWLTDIDENQVKLKIEQENKIVREVAIADTALMTKISGDGIVRDDDEWEEIVGSLRKVRQHQEEIFKLFLDMTDDESKDEEYELATFDLVRAIKCLCTAGDETNNDCIDLSNTNKGLVAEEEMCQKSLQTLGKTEVEPHPNRHTCDASKNKKIKLIGASLIYYTIYTCEKVCRKLSASNLHEECCDDTQLVLLKMCEEVRLGLRKLIKAPSTYSIKIGPGRLDSYFDIPAYLLKLLRNLMEGLAEFHRVTGPCKEASGLTEPKSLVSQNHTEQSCEHTIDNGNNDKCSPCPGGEQITNFLSSRPKIGSLPSYIPFN